MATGDPPRAPRWGTPSSGWSATRGRRPILVGGREVVAHEGAHLLCLPVEGVVVARGQRIRAEQDPADHLGPEPLGPRVAHHVLDVALDRGTVAVPHAVEPGEVRGAFGGGDQVVGGQGILGRRQRHLHDVRTGVGEPVDRSTPSPIGTSASMPSPMSSVTTPMRMPETPPSSERLRSGTGPSMLVASMRSQPATASSSDTASFDGPGEGADLVERGGEGDQAVPGNEAVGRLHADDARQGRRLADRAAGVAPEGTEGGTLPQRPPPSRPDEPPGTRSVSHGFRVVTEGGVLGRRPHGELVEVGLAHDDGARRARSRATTVPSYGGFHPERIFDEAVVSTPFVHMLSLRASGMPWSGPWSSPDARSVSACSAADRAPS